MALNTICMLMTPKFIPPTKTSSLISSHTFSYLPGISNWFSQKPSMSKLKVLRSSDPLPKSVPPPVSPFSVNGISAHLVSIPKPRKIHFHPFVSLTFHIPSITKSCQFHYKYFVNLFLLPVPPAQHIPPLSLFWTTIMS